MMKNRIISTLLAVLMLLGAFTLMVSAEDEVEVFTPEYNTKSSTETPTINYLQGRINPKDTGAKPTGAVIETPEQKLETMDCRYEKDGYRLYVDAYSGEVAVENIASGEILFSNPYDVGSSTATNDIKSHLLSQIKINFTDIVSGDAEEYWSYEWAATRGQIRVKNIKGGLRVEYTIGREQAKMLVPECIEKSSFENQIYNVIIAAMTDDEDGFTATDEFTFNKLMAYYSLKDTSAMTSQATITETQKAFPITKKMAVYVLDPATSSNEKAKLEQVIKTYAPNYTYENLDEDHLKTEYESEDENPPLFKLALEYTLDEYGLVVRLPANGIRFSESLFRLDSIEILPYMGAGSNPNSGYTFFPDGSGTLFDFEETAALGTSAGASGKVYGVDYAYHDITGTHQETIRYPVFGVYENQGVTTTETTTTVDDAGKEVTTTTSETTYKERGYVAIVEEGDAMMELTVYHAVRTDEYNTVKMAVYPRPQDTYNVADAISVGQNDTWTVVSARKYTGNYKVRYIMLTSDKVVEEKGLEGTYYDTSYVGMAKAYRDYLIRNDVLTRLTEDDVKSDIPLYIETFGAMETTERFLSIPFQVMTPLTTFADINTMYDELSAKGISNINFIMTGYTKGGLTNPAAPYKLKWENAVEDGGMKFEELVAAAREKGFQVFPDVDFAFTSTNTLFDGVNLKKHAVKTIDDRYTSKREYSATKQTYISYYELALSPAYFSHFYEKFTENYLKYQPIGISVSTLGSYLNSDFDEEDPYNRSDAKDFTEKAFQYIRENYGKVMTAGGNAFSWKYVDYITDISLDSSRFAQASAAVPFLGIVLHGYVEYAGTAINMEGNIEYAMLKAIENGAAFKFILSYQNTDNLKDYVLLSQYYSVRYDIWQEDLIELYTELNAVLKDLQTSTIEEHMFLNDGTRIPDSDELESDLADAIADAIESEKKLAAEEKEALRKKLHETRTLINETIAEKFANAILKPADSSTVTVAGNIDKMNNDLAALKLAVTTNEELVAILEGHKTTLATARNNTAEKYVTIIGAAINGTDTVLKPLAQSASDASSALVAAKNEVDAKQTAYDNALAAANNDETDAAVVAAKGELDTANQTFATKLSEYEAADKDFNDALNAAGTSTDATVAAAIADWNTAKTAEAAAQKLVDDAQANIDTKAGLADATSYINNIYSTADKTIKEIRSLIAYYDDAVAGYELIVAENAFTANIRNNLKNILDANKATYDALKNAESAFSEAAVIAIAKDAYKFYSESLASSAPAPAPGEGEGEGEGEEEGEQSAVIKDYEYVEEEKKEETTTKKEEKTFNKYATDKNKIVYMEYVTADGDVTALILNFNNYAVVVTAPNGVTYTIEAYGYITLKPAND